MASISGTVIRYGTTERIQFASVKATDAKGKIVQTITDDDGDFCFSDLALGKWSIVALNEESFPNSPISIDLTKNVDNIQIKLQRLAGEVDQNAGRRFFNSLLIGLGILIILYIVMHILFPMKTDESVDPFFWDAYPWRYVEIIVWALGGILVNKIITCGWYLRCQSFFREGIVMHVAHLVATPLCVLVAVIIISLATLTLTISEGTDVTLDLSQLPILIAVSFLLGTSPWPVWNFIEKSAKKLIGQTEAKK